MKKLTVAVIVLSIMLVPKLGESEDILTVAVSSFEPCIITQGDKPTGHDIELWEAIAKDLNLEYDYLEVDFHDIFNGLQKKEVDVAVAGITINEEREKIVDFSHPYINAGLLIAVNKQQNTSLLFTLKTIFTPSLVRVFIILLLFVMFSGHVIWLSERGKDAISDSYFPGIFEGFYWAIVTVSTVGYGDIAPKNWSGRIVASSIILIGLGIFGLYIGEVSSALTLNKMSSSIQSPKDLANKRVGTVKNTTSVAVLEELNAVVHQYDKINAGYEDLTQGQLDAIVFDSVNVLYNVKRNNDLKTVGNLFDEQYYGFAFPEGSKLREKVNRSLLKLEKNGTKEAIYNKWFNNN